MAERLAADCVRNRCKISNIGHPRDVVEWKVVANLYCLQFGQRNEWLELSEPLEQLYISAIGILLKKLRWGWWIWSILGRLRRYLRGI